MPFLVWGIAAGLASLATAVGFVMHKKEIEEVSGQAPADKLPIIGYSLRELVGLALLAYGVWFVVARVRKGR